MMRYRVFILPFLILAVVAVFTSPGTAAEGEKTLTVRLSAEDGSPVAGGKFSVWGNPKPASWSRATLQAVTDDNGEYIVRFGKDDVLQKFNINVKSPGYSPYYAQWESPAVDPIPERYEITLKKATTVGGLVTDEQGKPIAGAKVEFSLPWGDRIRVKEPNFYCAMRAETDENGIWKNETVPPELLDEQSNFSLSHPDFMDASQRFAVADFLPDENGRFVKTMTMRPGVTVSGRVVDENGKPVEGAVVVGEYRVYGN
ncbi:MAG: hypothetical protein FWC50_14145, partial [Planctomycetaceae bacterium]|nr:hypothetical protein [Planctomycetaceae bacterium]